MDPDPTARPQTGAEALQHPFLEGVVQQLQATAEDAAADWDKAHEDLRALLRMPAWQPIPLPDTPQPNCGQQQRAASTPAATAPAAC